VTEFESVEGVEGVPLAPASRSLRHSARPPPRREDSEELHLPSVIVDLANDCRMLLARLIEGDTQAGDKLVQVGGTAVTVLVAAFPGPISSEPRRGAGEGLAKASDCGPVLRTLARIGVKAVPVIVVRTADGDPNVRAWATRLLGEMPTEEATRAVVRRFSDEHPDVRRAALAAGRLLQQHQETALALHEGLSDLVLDTKRPEEFRHAIIEALADLRDGNGVPTLIRLVQDPTPDIVRSAHWALVVITHQDFSTNAAMWEEWWRQNGQRHRIEWLIDALMHDSQEIRRAAGDELKALTKEYFGYYDDLPLKERLRAQERYREWWGTKGKARFR
jgi:HEAT repeats